MRFLNFFYKVFSVFPDLDLVNHIKKYLLICMGATIGKSVLISRKSIIVNPSNLIMGCNSGIGRGNIINCHGSVTVGDRVLIGPNISIFTANHVWSSEKKTYFKQGFNIGIVEIGDDSWIGANVIILPNVILGKGVTIGAGSVVTKSIPDYAVAVGVPAKVISYKGVGNENN